MKRRREPDRILVRVQEPLVALVQSGELSKSAVATRCDARRRVDELSMAEYWHKQVFGAGVIRHPFTASRIKGIDDHSIVLRRSVEIIDHVADECLILTKAPDLLYPGSRDLCHLLGKLHLVLPGAIGVANC